MMLIAVSVFLIINGTLDVCLMLQRRDAGAGLLGVVGIVLGILVLCGVGK